MTTTTFLIQTVLHVGKNTLRYIRHKDTWVVTYAVNDGTDTLLAVIATISDVGNGCFLAKPKDSKLGEIFFKEEALQNFGLSRAAKGDPVLLVGIAPGGRYDEAMFVWRLKTENRQLPDGREQGVIVGQRGGLGAIKTYDEKIIGYRLTGKTTSIAVGAMVSFKKTLDRSGIHIAEDIQVE
jgi:hypothetical protein